MCFIEVSAYDTFSASMGAGTALSLLNGAFDLSVGHNHNPASTGNGAMIPTTALSGMIATSILSGNIAGTTISGPVISATLATTATVLSGNIAGANVSGAVASATTATGLNGTVYTGSYTISDGANYTTVLGTPSAHRYLLISVYSPNAMLTQSDGPVTNLVTFGIQYGFTAVDADKLTFYNRNGLGLSIPVYWKVLVVPA